MSSLRMSHEEKVLCGLALNPGVSLKDGVSDEETLDEARLKKGFVPDEELGADHVLSGCLSESDRQACMDPLEYALRKRDPEQYGVKTFGRNLRLV